MATKLRLGDLLISAGRMTDEQLSRALKVQKETGMKLGEVLVQEDIISEDELLKVLAEQMGIPIVDLSSYNIERDVAKQISESVARRNNIIPIALRNNKLIVATADPLDVVAIDDIRMTTGFETVFALATKSGIQQAINQNYDAQDEVDKAIQEFSMNNNIIDIELMDVEEDEVTNSPMVRLVNTILNQAVKQGASDVHIEPFENRVRVRFRIDGELIETMTATKATHSAIVTRIKIISNLDISEKRKPQDGRLETKILNRNIDLRISILPTVYGEKVVIRLLDRDSLLVSKEQLNLSKANEEAFDKLCRMPEGMILITGPTGSGKTTTLYSILKDFNKINTNIITVEDPVEYRIDGINQVQVNPKAGLDFANSLRSILRQDPNVVMIGEIRDGETAEIAARAAITGHVVLSTLHTNDTASTVSRLVDMGIEPYLVSSSVVGVIAQRLVKKICKSCKTSYTTSEEEMKFMKIDEPMTIYKGKGCNICSHTGYKGRTAIHEILIVDQQVRSLINNRSTVDDIREHSLKQGLQTLNHSCIELVKQGQTTVQEMIKVTYSIDNNN